MRFRKTYLQRIYTCLGPPGKSGEPGPQGTQGIKGDSGGVTGGAVYTRWGRRDCPQSVKTTMLYSGNCYNIIYGKGKVEF